MLPQAAADGLSGRQRRRLCGASGAARRLRGGGRAHAGPARCAARRPATAAPVCAGRDGADAVRLARRSWTASGRDPRRTSRGGQRGCTRGRTRASRFCVCFLLARCCGSLERTAAAGARGNRRRGVQPGSWRGAAVRHLALAETACAAGGRRTTRVRAPGNPGVAAAHSSPSGVAALASCSLLTGCACRGISSTLCALDALALRGYDVEAVVIIDSEDGLNNADAVRAHLPRGTLLFALPALPAGADAGAEGCVSPRVARWLDACAPQFRELARSLQHAHARRLAAFAAAPSQARAKLWWPFTQHDDVRDADVTVVDGRSGDALLVHNAAEVRLHALGGVARRSRIHAQASITPLFDACSSWWTQGVSAAMQPQLTRAVGCALCSLLCPHSS